MVSEKSIALMIGFLAILILIVIAVGIVTRFPTESTARKGKILELCAEWNNPPNKCDETVYTTIGNGDLQSLCNTEYPFTGTGVNPTCKKMCLNDCNPVGV